MYGAALLPACYGAGRTLVLTAQGITFTAGAGVWFLAGAAVYLVVHLALWKPLRVYIFGHELVHALSALLCGGSVSGLACSRRRNRQVASPAMKAASARAVYTGP